MLSENDLSYLIQTARQAGEVVMDVYALNFPEDIEVKSDNSPLTVADKRSNKVILEALRSRFPQLPVISEETKQVPYEVRRKWKSYWLVDPLDGTKEFIKKNGEFTINIALMQDSVPIAGVIYAPALDKLWYALKGAGAYVQEGNQEARQLKRGHDWRLINPVRVVASRSHMDDRTMQFVEKLWDRGVEVRFVSSGSSIKFCMVAEGLADVYPRYGPTMEWDTAAGQAILELTGGRVYNADTHQRLFYNKENLLNPPFIAEFIDLP
ncbi:MAG: 3'(2'),5'-bisphosphate nucleotidase CysQ [Chitinophagales bacterium]|nr:3'(2'),5'-bisphosphate nucleotidase CysQ [Chitinophagales bacterium]MDW8427880.1 3'(2'),5'-bisphosphate nucleotidase CysQ [Chitinophagales bacterium]